MRHNDVMLQLASLLTCNHWLNASVAVQSDGRHRIPKLIPLLSKKTSLLLLEPQTETMSRGSDTRACKVHRYNLMLFI